MLALVDKDSYEARKMLEAAKTSGVEHHIIKPENVFYKLYEKGNIEIWHDGKDLSKSAFYIRKIGDTSRNLLGRITSAMTGNDNPHRFVLGGLSKINSDIQRVFSNENKLTSYICPTKSTFLKYLDKIELPVVYKLTKSSHGKGMELISTKEELLKIAEKHSWTKPIFLQHWKKISKEFRVVMVGDEIVNYVQKRRIAGKLFSGRGFKKAEELPQDLIAYLKKHPTNGVTGIDVFKPMGEKKDDCKWYILERNRANEWSATDEKSGVDTAQEIIKRLVKKG